MDLDLRERGKYLTSPLEAFVIPIARLLKPVIEFESCMNVDWVEVMVIKTIANLSASQHPESIVTHPYQRPS